MKSGARHATMAWVLARRRILTTAQTAQRRPEARVLYMALALGWDDWTVGFPVGLGQAPRPGAVRARDLAGLLAQIAQAKRRFGLAADVPVHGV